MEDAADEHRLTGWVGDERGRPSRISDHHVRGVDIDGARPRAAAEVSKLHRDGGEVVVMATPGYQVAVLTGERLSRQLVQDVRPPHLVGDQANAGRAQCPDVTGDVDGVPPVR